MAHVEEAKVFKIAADVELARTRQRIAELEGQLAKKPALAEDLVRRGGRIVLQLAALVLVVAGVAAACHRLLVWGWP